jgi:hypothetical protein
MLPCNHSEVLLAHRRTNTTPGEVSVASARVREVAGTREKRFSPAATNTTTNTTTTETTTAAAAVLRQHPAINAVGLRPAEHR